MTTTTPVFPARKAVLAQFEPTAALAPFTRRRAAAMLEIMTRPVIHHWLDALSIAGVKDLVVLASSFPEQVRAFIGRGERWGFESVEFISVAELTKWQQVLSRLDTETAANSVFASLNSFPVEPLIHLASSEDFWFGSAFAKRKALSKRKVLSRRKAVPILTPGDLWQVNMDQVAKLRETQIEPGTYVDTAIRLEQASQIATRVVMDRQSKLTCAVIGKDTCIADGCELNETVVFSNTRLGSHLFADRLLIDGPLIYSVDTGCLLQLDDPVIATRLKQKSQKISLSEKMLASVLLLVTWPQLLFCSKQPEALRIVDADTFGGETGGRELKVVSLESDSRFTKRIPWLLSVIKGELPLFGSRELTDIANDTPGVISLADFGRQEEIDILIANRYQQHVGNLKTNLVLAGKWLPRAMLRSN